MYGKIILMKIIVVSIMNKMIFYRSEQLEYVIIKNGILRFDEHSHASDIVISGIVTGSAFLKLNGKEHVLNSGDVFSVLPYENHSLTSDEPVCMLTMCIKKDLFFLEMNAYTNFVTAAVNGLCAKSELSESEKNTARRLCKTALTIYDAAYEALTSETDILLEKGRQMIESYPEIDDNIQSLADNSFISKYHYIRRFKEISGLTPNRFRLQCRVRKAQLLIADGEKVSDAAAISGFYDQSHFDRYFKRIVGISPKEYIHSLRNFVQE